MSLLEQLDRHVRLRLRLLLIDMGLMLLLLILFELARRARRAAG